MAPTIVFAPQALDTIRSSARRQRQGSHDEAVGGILIGKRDGDRIMILAATEPGPKPDDQRLGFALDFEQANGVLQAWFGRDADADIAGIWHTHPSDLSALTPDDVAATYSLQDGGSRDVVSALAFAADDETIVTCFVLDAAATPPVAPVRVRYGVEGVPSAPIALPIPDQVPEPIASIAPVPMTIATEAANASRRKRSLMIGLILVILGLLLAGSFRSFVGGRITSNPTPQPAPASSSVAEVLPTASATNTPEATDTPLPSPTTQPTALPTASPTLEPTPEQPTPTIGVTPSPAQFQFLLSIEPMTPTARTRFLARARNAKCVDCYNVDLIPPDPYTVLRLKIDNADPPALQTYNVPSLVFLEPRAAPRTLQAFDLEGNPVSPPLSVAVAADGFYTLRISAP